MTEERKKQIMARDALTIADVQELLGLSYWMAAKVIRDIKRKHDRLGIRGKVHVQDYLDYYRLDRNQYLGRIGGKL